MTILRVEHLEEWLLEELAESGNWGELLGVDAYVLRCLSGPNKGTFVGNTDRVEIEGDMLPSILMED